MSGVAIYMEGGGPSPYGKAALRQGMDRFLRPLKETARERSLFWRLVPCGSREETYRRFRHAVENSDPDGTQILLVDSEALVTRTARAHLQERDDWDLSFALEHTIHLMAQVMETWIVADPDALARYYGQRFNVGKLPRRQNLEQESKASIERALKDATRRTGKGVYHKIKHARELLTRLDPTRVKKRCRHCKRLFEELERIIAAA